MVAGKNQRILAEVCIKIGQTRGCFQLINEVGKTMNQPTLIDIFGNYRAWMAKPGTWFISFMNGSQNMYLLEGDEKALLVDTGYAMGNLRRFVETLTTKPIEVINTHFHPDHAGGNGEWEEVYVRENWEKDAKSVLNTAGDLNVLPYPDYKKIPVRDGDCIELGNRKISIIALKDCHCYSELYLFDEKEKLLFMGDEIDSAQVLLFDNSNDQEQEKTFSTEKALKNFRDNLVYVRSNREQFDWILPCHNGAPLDKSYLDDYIGLVNGVFSGETTICDTLEHPFIEQDPKADRLARIRRGKASAFVFKDQLMEIYGKGES